MADYYTGVPINTTLLTYADVISHVLDYVGADTTVATERKARRAVQNAISDFWSKRNWAIFYKRGRINTEPLYQTGTVEYLLSSGAVPRQLTLTGGTWPVWAGDCNVLSNRVGYPVALRISDTVLQLQTLLAPNVDWPAGTPYQLCQESYPLPVDFGSAGEVINLGRAGTMTYQTPDQFIQMQRILIGPALPWMYTVQADSRRYGTLVMSFYPAPDIFYQMDYSYRRQSRGLSSHGAVPVVAYTDGSVSVGSASTTVTGTNTQWTPDMVGAVLRFGSGPTSKMPTGQSGASPFFVQRTIVGYTGPATLTIDQVPGVSLTNVPHAISDPVDLEAGAMTTYFLRECECQMRMIMRTEPTKFEEAKYKEALRDAFEADSRHHEARATGSSGMNRVRVANMPKGQGW